MCYFWVLLLNQFPEFPEYLVCAVRVLHGVCVEYCNLGDTTLLQSPLGVALGPKQLPILHSFFDDKIVVFLMGRPWGIDSCWLTSAFYEKNPLAPQGNLRARRSGGPHPQPGDMTSWRPGCTEPQRVEPDTHTTNTNKRVNVNDAISI